MGFTVARASAWDSDARSLSRATGAVGASALYLFRPPQPSAPPSWCVRSGRSGDWGGRFQAGRRTAGRERLSVRAGSDRVAQCGEGTDDVLLDGGE